MFDRDTNGLLLSSVRMRSPAGPVCDGTDVSWIEQCRLGDDQGADGACAIFSMASWAEIVHGSIISDSDCLSLYAETCNALGRDRGTGLHFWEAFDAAKDAGWMPGAKDILLTDDLSELKNQPILAGYEVTNAWRNANSAGCLDHEGHESVIGYHAVVVVAYGDITGNDNSPFVYVENSWGKRWGWNGIGVMTEALHKKHVQQLWVIE